MEDIIIPVGFFLLIFAIVYVYYTTRNKERMALIEKGADPKLFSTASKISHYATFKWGLFMVGVAMGVFVGVLFDTYSKLESDTMFVASILVFGGLALILAYLLRVRLEKKNG